MLGPNGLNRAEIALWGAYYAYEHERQKRKG